MKEHWKTAALLLAVLLVPIVPFVILSSQLEPWAEQMVSESYWSEHLSKFGLLVIGLLVVDILLPIPSSVVCTLAGSVFGSFVGTLVCWLGLNLSAIIGFWLARLFGPPFVRLLVSEEQLSETQSLVNRLGPWALAICRALPVLAEASVIYVGIYRMDSRRFWAPILTANFGIALAFCVLGDLASEQEWIAVALAISISVPLTAAVSWLWLVRRKPNAPIKESV